MYIAGKTSHCAGPPPWVSALLLLVPGTMNAGEVILVDGIPHVMNPARPPQGVPTVELEEL
jgi:hypothetical protein